MNRHERYNRSPKGKARYRRYQQSDKGRAAQQRFRDSHIQVRLGVVRQAFPVDPERKDEIVQKLAAKRAELREEHRDGRID